MGTWRRPSSTARRCAEWLTGGGFRGLDSCRDCFFTLGFRVQGLGLRICVCVFFFFFFFFFFFIISVLAIIAVHTVQMVPDLSCPLCPNSKPRP